MEKRKGSVVDAFLSYHQAGAPMYQLLYILVVSGSQQDSVAFSQWEPSSVGGYKPTEEGHPTVSN